MTYLPSIFEYQLGEPQPRSLLRSQLVTVGRLQGGVDKVEYPDGQLAVFKYNPYAGGHHTWREIQVLAQVSGHSHILPLDALVLEEVTGQGVVSFTSRFVPGGTLEDRRQFKLRWLREAMGVIDHVNFQHGICHQDIANRNFLIDPDTDSVLLFDFGHSNPVGAAETLALRNDPKGLPLSVYHLITRGPRYDVYYLHDVDEAELEDRARWEKHSDVGLDCDLDVLFGELMAWVRKRRDGPQPTYEAAPNQVGIPVHPTGPMDRVADGDNMIDLVRTSAWQMTLHGRPNLRWRRPKRKDIDKSRRLLATGRYAVAMTGPLAINWQRDGLGDMALWRAARTFCSSFWSSASSCSVSGASAVAFNAASKGSVPRIAASCLGKASGRRSRHSAAFWSSPIALHVSNSYAKTRDIIAGASQSSILW